MIENVDEEIILDYLEVNIKLRKVDFELIGSQENKNNMYYIIKKVMQAT